MTNKQVLIAFRKAAKNFKKSDMSVDEKIRWWVCSERGQALLQSDAWELAMLYYENGIQTIDTAQEAIDDFYYSDIQDDDPEIEKANLESKINEFIEFIGE